MKLFKMKKISFEPRSIKNDNSTRATIQIAKCLNITDPVDERETTPNIAILVKDEALLLSLKDATDLKDILGDMIYQIKDYMLDKIVNDLTAQIRADK